MLAYVPDDIRPDLTVKLLVTRDQIRIISQIKGKTVPHKRSIS